LSLRLEGLEPTCVVGDAAVVTFISIGSVPSRNAKGDVAA